MYADKTMNAMYIYGHKRGHNTNRPYGKFFVWPVNMSDQNLHQMPGHQCTLMNYLSSNYNINAVAGYVV